MLTINITPSNLVFKDLTDELQQEIESKFDLEFIFKKDKPHLEGTPEQLFKILYLLSTTYDIELV